MRQLTKKEVKRAGKETPKRDQEIYLILENIQYATNVASIFRTADAAAVKRIYLTGISQKPPFGKDLRKTSRSKEDSVEWMYEEISGDVMAKLRKLGFFFVAIELTDNSTLLSDLKDDLKDKEKVCFIAGSEVYGIKKSTLEKVDLAVAIPMYGKGGSLNVSTAVGIVLYSF